MRKYERHTAEEKARALERMVGCVNLAALARELGLKRCLLYSWKRQQERKQGATRQPEQMEVEVEKLRKENRRLREVLGRRTLEIDFFKGALRRIEARRQASGDSGGTASTKRSE
jgi:transposase-like protein